jgi:hypothetical protein
MARRRKGKPCRFIPLSSRWWPLASCCGCSTITFPGQQDQSSINGVVVIFVVLWLLRAFAVFDAFAPLHIQGRIGVSCQK